MKIETKFNINDYVYCVRYYDEHKRFECELCNGTGNVKIEKSEKTAMCPECYFGYIKKAIRRRYVIDGKEQIYGINITSKGLKYCCWHGRQRSEETLFATEKEAQEYCNEMNKKRKFNYV